MQRKMSTAAAVLCVCLAGCASWPTQHTTQEGLNALMGKSSQEAFEVLGQPLLTVQATPATTYTWVSAGSGTYEVSTGPSLADNRSEDFQCSCAIKLVAGPDGKLIRSETMGSSGDFLACCYDYMVKLTKYGLSMRKK